MKNINLHPKKSLLMLIVYMTIPYSGICLDLYSPSLPAISHAFATSRHLVQLTMTIYMLAFGCGQLISGIISDRYGRKPILLIGCITQCFIVTTIIFNKSINVLILLRFLQGLSAALMIVPSRAIVSDLFTGSEFRRRVMYYSAAWALSPIIAPWIGGHLQHNFGWQAGFTLMLSYIIIISALAITFLQETHTTKNNTASLKKLFPKYISMLRDPYFVGTLSTIGVGFGIFLLFSLIAPFITEHILKLTPIVYGRMALCLGFSLLLGNICCRWLSNNDHNLHIQIGLVIMALGIITFWILHLTRGMSITTLLVPNIILIYAVGLITPVIISKSLSKYADQAGMANALLFSGSWSVDSLIGYIGSFINPSHFHIYLAYVSLIVIGIIVIFCKFIFIKL